MPEPNLDPEVILGIWSRSKAVEVRSRPQRRVGLASFSDHRDRLKRRLIRCSLQGASLHSPVLKRLEFVVDGVSGDGSAPVQLD